MNQQALTRSAAISAVLQVIMVFVNFKLPGILGGNLPPIGGTAIGAVGGLLYGMLSNGGTQAQNAGGGAAAGAVGGLVGSVASMAMNWGATTETVAIATGSTAVSGAIGGILGKMFGGRA